MKPLNRYLLPAVLSLVAMGVLLYLITQVFSGPLVYSLEKDTFSSRFHDNPEALKDQALNSTTDILPLMQDLIDYSGPVVLNIRLRDYDQARRDLDLLTQGNRRFNSLVVRLDMNESEIQDFQKSSARQKELLQNLMNDSATLDTLQNLEVQYRGRNDQKSLNTVKLQGDALRKKIHQIYTEYEAETQTVMAIGENVGADVRPQEESLREFDSYIHQIEQPIEQPGNTDDPDGFSIMRSAQLSLISYPETGTYGDLIDCTGSYFSLYGYQVKSVPNRSVTIYIDTKPVSSGITDGIGSYSIRVPIERVMAGTHTIHAESDKTISELRSLEVFVSDSTTTLSVSRPNASGWITCTGSVMANRSVRAAPVELVLDGEGVNTTVTDKNGKFTKLLQLPAGRHTMVARFDAGGFPLRPSESAPQTVTVSTPFALPLIPLLAGTLILVTFAGGAWYYLRRMKGMRTAAATREKNEEPVVPAVEPGTDLPPELVQEKPAEGGGGDDLLIDRYTRLLQEQGLSAAARMVYIGFSGRIARTLHIPRHAALTPRELSRTCTGKPFCRPFASFVQVYEQIRYGGYKSGDVQAEFETEMKNTDSHLGGEDH